MVNDCVSKPGRTRRKEALLQIVRIEYRRQIHFSRTFQSFEFKSGPFTGPGSLPMKCSVSWTVAKTMHRVTNAARSVLLRQTNLGRRGDALAAVVLTVNRLYAVCRWSNRWRTIVTLWQTELHILSAYFFYLSLLNFAVSGFDVCCITRKMKRAVGNKISVFAFQPKASKLVQDNKCISEKNVVSISKFSVTKRETQRAIVV